MALCRRAPRSLSMSARPAHSADTGPILRVLSRAGVPLLICPSQLLLALSCLRVHAILHARAGPVVVDMQVHTSRSLYGEMQRQAVWGWEWLLVYSHKFACSTTLASPNATSYTKNEVCKVATVEDLCSRAPAGPKNCFFWEAEHME